MAETETRSDTVYDIVEHEGYDRRAVKEIIESLRRSAIFYRVSIGIDDESHLERKIESGIVARAEPKDLDIVNQGDIAEAVKIFEQARQKTGLTFEDVKAASKSAVYSAYSPIAGSKPLLVAIVGMELI